MQTALYGPDGFFRAGAGPAAHFRTSVHTSPLFARALLRLIERVDEALGHPVRLDVVDVGAGRGELLSTLSGLLPSPEPAGGAPLSLAERVRFVGVEVADRPTELASAIGWEHTVPDGIVGVLLATEWLDNVPLDVAEVDDAGVPRQVLVSPDGTESMGDRVAAADAFWLARWWPLDDAPPGSRAEIGAPRDLAWADAVANVRRGCALAVDYGHLRADRPAFGTLTGYRDGRQVSPVPDGSTDVTAHVAMDAVAAAVGTPYTLCSQREALRALGVDGGRPALSLAGTDPAGYVRALATASAAAELTDPAGLGGHWWLLHEIGIDARATMLG
ncbi:MAG TPA: SAM-dependent methyltransferase [Actinoplanes sp.]|nr:SAM-dependent methyltransferase [Actinoplanes sp.]